MSFWRTYYHLIWATHRRQAWITPAMEAQLFPYLVQQAAALEVSVLAVNGWTDHIHLVVAIPPKLSVAGVVQRLKGTSAHYLNDQVQAVPSLVPHFAWQEGYGVLTIGERHCPIAVDYVQRQKEHHAAQQTNAWLERTEEEDVGPHPLGAAIDAQQTKLREGPPPIDEG